ncbi:glycosyltransferase family 2 protein [Mycena sanguinolenta]|nr:glycosyltransferase family 2 protein [Mycena sanguinolenta]
MASPSRLTAVSFQVDEPRSLLVPDAETGGGNIPRRKSLVRPDRERIGPGHRQWHYRNRVAQLEEEKESGAEFVPTVSRGLPTVNESRTGTAAVRRGKSILGRDQDSDVHESGLAIFERAATLRRKRRSLETAPLSPTKPHRSGCLGDYAPGPKGAWMLYCYLLTFWIPVAAMRVCGLRSREQQRAWREKIGLVAIILLVMAFVGFFTFGFTEVVCGSPPKRFHGGDIGTDFIGTSSVVINGYDYDFSTFNHPAAGTTFDGTTNPLNTGGWDLGGNDASFLFQKVNQHCLGLITPASGSDIASSGQTLQWYFPCNVRSQYGTTSPNTTGYAISASCHTSSTARSDLSAMQAQGQVYFTWDDVHNTSRNLAVFEQKVLDLELLDWLNATEVNYPAVFDQMKVPGGDYNHQDITMTLYRQNLRTLGRCLQDIATVGFVDSATIGCVASEVVLYASLTVIIGAVLSRFVLAVFFSWCFARKIGNFPAETREERRRRATEIEAWSDGIYRPPPSSYRPEVGKNGVVQTKARNNKKKTFLPVQSRYTPAFRLPYGNSSTSLVSPHRRAESSASLVNRMSGASYSIPADVAPPFRVDDVVPQPPADYQPFNFPLAHTICLVTAYSEGREGLRTTLDSLATTDYPNSHKVILIIADGMVKGAGNKLTTPEICVSMLKDTVTGSDFSTVPAHSYVAIADGHKRHNMAKIFAGFYNYDGVTTELSKQQRVPVIVVAKCGNPLEVNDGKPGNRGKRDSQMVLMSFLQKVLFDERMTSLEYELFNALWAITGVSPDRYELALCIDADTKAFPDSLSRMVACMVHDPEVMGLCGETKIANKADSWVTMIQVFEYYISHHLTKAFESLFGTVTCLPGCFSMYRIKAPKGDGSGYWVPILANPDIVEHYSENIVDTLHKKNLLLLGEDRYLTTLMLKTFPKRKNVFCPQAVCKTVVPDTFSVLLSQRRRWINSTVHNLLELVQVRDSCGTFCFSMQFMVGIELLGTLVLPAAISFTIYLIVNTIIPGGPNNTIPLILLALILGLPGLLIVITSTKLAYVVWMLIYLISLPIWNGILPAYAFWHFDDFSWGQTRKVSGDTTHTGDKEGEFEASHIIMKRWAEFERERRLNLPEAYLFANSEILTPREGGRDSVALIRIPAPLASPLSPPISPVSDGDWRNSAVITNVSYKRDSVGVVRTPHSSPRSPAVSPAFGGGRNTPVKPADDYLDSPRPRSFFARPSSVASDGSQPMRQTSSRVLDSPVPRSNWGRSHSSTTSPDPASVESYLEEAVPARPPAIHRLSYQLTDHGPVPNPSATSRAQPRRLFRLMNPSSYDSFSDDQNILRSTR